MRHRTQSTDLRACVIGAGPSGITAARHLLAAGVANVAVFEQNSRIGGNWVYDERPGHSSVYETTHLISSKKYSQFDGFPMPSDFPDYPSHRQILSYFDSYAERFEVLPRVRFDTRVERVAAIPEGGWAVSWRNGADSHVDRFDAVVAASGHHWCAAEPRYPGTFTGTMLHSHDYRNAAMLRGQRVLVIGGGNSGCEIATEAGRVARTSCLSLRRGYHFIPKLICGRPSDRWLEPLSRLPRPLAQRLMQSALWLAHGSYRKYGLPKPTHRPLDFHPIVNSELLLAIRHGRVQTRPAVERFDGPRVHFIDGRAEEFDVVIAATGYRAVFPYLRDTVPELAEIDRRPPLHLLVISSALRHLYFVGLVQPAGCIWALSDLQSQLVARAVTGAWRFPEGAVRQRGWQLGTGETARHAFEVDYWRYRRALLRELRRTA